MVYDVSILYYMSVWWYNSNFNSLSMVNEPCILFNVISAAYDMVARSWPGTKSGTTSFHMQTRSPLFTFDASRIRSAEHLSERGNVGTVNVYVCTIPLFSNGWWLILYDRGWTMINISIIIVLFLSHNADILYKYYVKSLLTEFSKLFCFATTDYFVFLAYNLFILKFT